MAVRLDGQGQCERINILSQILEQTLEIMEDRHNLVQFVLEVSAHSAFGCVLKQCIMARVLGKQAHVPQGQEESETPVPLRGTSHPHPVT